MINTIIDIGTGSGCIAVTLAKELPHLKIIATDISHSALRVAKINVTHYNAQNQVQLLCGNLLTPLIKNNLLTPQTLLVANLPYLDSKEIIGEIQHEPNKALIAKEQGLSIYRELFLQLSKLTFNIRPRYLIAESHPKTSHEFQIIFYKYFPNGQIVIHSDLQNQPRIFELTLEQKTEH